MPDWGEYTYNCLRNTRLVTRLHQESYDSSNQMGNGVCCVPFVVCLLPQKRATGQRKHCIQDTQ